MKRGKFFLFLLPAILLLALPKPSHSAFSDSKTFNTTKDSYANEAYPDKVNGNYNHLIVSNKFTTRLVYLQFEAVDLPEGAILDSATFKFFVYDVNYADTAKLNVGPISGDWEENSLTWNNKPTINQTQAVEAEISLVDTGWKEVAVTNLVQKWLDGSTEDKGIFIYPYGFLYASPETEFAITARSKEATENQPKMEVVYHFAPSPVPSPEPSLTSEVEPTEEPEEEMAIAKEEPSPLPEESPSPSPEAEEQGTILGIFSPGQAVIGGLILLALIGAGISFATYARKKPKKEPKQEKKENTEE